MVQLLISNIIIYPRIISKLKPRVFQPLMWTVLLCGIMYQNDANCQDSTNIQSDTLNLADTLKSKSGLEAIVNYSAEDSIRFDLPNKLVHLYGKAKIRYEDMDLDAGYILINFNTKTLFAKGTTDSAGNHIGRPHFNSGGQETDVDSLSYDFETKRGRMRGVTMQEGEGFIHMDKVYRSETGSIFSNIGKYTTCNHDNPHFYLKARKLKLMPNDKIVFGPSNLVIEEVSTPLVLPFGIFPTKQGRKSGIVFPEIGSEVIRGFNLRNLGYYFGISDNMDLLLAGDVYFRGSWAIRGKTRYIKRYKYNGGLEIHYNRNIIGEQEDESYVVSPDFKIIWNHNQDMKARPGTTFTGRVDMRSSNYSRNNEVDAQQIVQNEFTSSINYGKNFAKSRMNLNISGQHRQNTATRDITVSLPNINFGVARRNPFTRKNGVGKKKWYEKIGVSYNTSIENKVQTKDSLLFEGKAWDEFKMGMSHSIPISTTVKVGFLTLSPNLSWNDYWYIETDKLSYDTSQENDVRVDEVSGFRRGGNGSIGVNANTRIFGTFQFTRSKKLVALRHVITPNVGFSYRPDWDNSFYQSYQIPNQNNDSFGYYSIFRSGIKGGPSRGESGSINFSLNNNFELKTRNQEDTAESFNYVKILDNLSFTGNYNLLADSLNLSNISVNARTTLFKKLNVSGRMNYAPYARDTFGRSINTFELDKNGRLARLTSAQLLFNFSLQPDDFKKGGKDKKKTDMYRPLPYYYYDANFVDFNVPWSLNFDYNMDFNPEAENKIQQTLGFRGDIRLTENWKIGYSSGYLLHEKEWAFTTFEIHRSLHCWQFSFNWIPTGYRQSFTFNISPKSSLLQELKLNKRKSWQDLNAQQF